MKDRHLWKFWESCQPTIKNYIARNIFQLESKFKDFLLRRYEEKTNKSYTQCSDDMNYPVKVLTDLSLYFGNNMEFMLCFKLILECKLRVASNGFIKI